MDGVQVDALLVVESWFGNTRAVADAIARGLSHHGARVQLVDVEDAPAEVPAGVGLVVLGAPTHNRGLSTVATRQKAVEAGAEHSATGAREWVDTVQLRDGVKVAVFDTVTSKSWLNGSAAKAAARILARRGLAAGIETKSFTVGGLKGPLGPGQADTAQNWGRHLARQ